jgi:hypothetical protein
MFALLVGMGIVVSFVLPPFQAPDEGAHWGVAVRRVHGLFSGEGKTCAPALSLPDRLHAGRMMFNPEAKWKTGQISRLDNADTACEEHEIGYGNTLTYPGAVGAHLLFDLVRSDGIGALKAFFATRLLHGLLILALLARLAFLARALPGPVPGLALLMAVTTTPLFAQSSFTVTADVVTNASVLALVNLLLAGPRVAWVDLAVAALIGYVGAVTKYTNAPLFAALGIACLLLYGAKGKRPRIAGGLGGALALTCVVAFVSVSSSLNLNGQQDPSIDAARQVQYVLDHPGHFAAIMIDVLDQLTNPRPWLGPLGWLDTTVPDSAFRLWRSLANIAVVIDLLAVITLFPPLRAAVQRAGLQGTARLGVAYAGIVAGIVLGVIGPGFAMYLAWTPVGFDGLMGFQRRYCFPSAILACGMLMPLAHVATPAEPGGGTPPRVTRVLQLLLAAAAFGLALRYLTSIHLMIAGRYY